MNLAWSLAYCSPANEIKATFASLPAFNYVSGRTVRAWFFNEKEKDREGEAKKNNCAFIALWTCSKLRQLSKTLGKLGLLFHRSVVAVKVYYFQSLVSQTLCLVC